MTTTAPTFWTNFNKTTRVRLNIVRARLNSWQIEALLISDSANRRWLSGFTGSAGCLLIAHQRTWLISDSRYTLQAAREAPGITFVQDARTKNSFADFIKSTGLRVIGIEAGHVTLAEFDQLAAVDGVEWRPLTKTVEPLRQKKSAAEIDTIMAAAAITDAVVAAVPELARPGMTEKELVWELEKALRGRGGERFAFDPIVASGPNSALPHYHPGDRAFAAGDIILVDIGTYLDGYHSDLTRTFYLGAEPPEKFWQVYNTVRTAGEKAIAGLRGGVPGPTIDALARDHIHAAGFGDYFGHGLGHGVGLAIHEDPMLGRQHEITVPALSVVTVEPGIYIPDWGGVRIEDLVLVTNRGAECLSKCPKEPRIIIND